MLTVDLGEWASGGFTTRSGGVSSGNYSTMNLGAAVGDEPRAVAENRLRLARSVDASVVFMHQTHSDHVAMLGESWPKSGGALGADIPCDGLVSAEPGYAVAVQVADCVPVLLAGRGAVAAVHAGRRGVLSGIVTRAVSRMNAAGVAVTHAAIGPCICAKCYEVPFAMREESVAQIPQLYGTTSWGSPSLDLVAGVRKQLADCKVATINEVAACTLEDDRFFSYRGQATTGRFAGVVQVNRKSSGTGAYQGQRHAELDLSHRTPTGLASAMTTTPDGTKP